MRKISLIAAALAVIPLPTAVAAFSNIIISEVAYDLPGSDDPHEWVEIFNDTTTPIDLTDWRFNDGSNHLLVAPPKNGGQGSLTIAPQAFAVLADDAATFLADHPGFSGTVIDTVMNLGNTTETLLLIRPDGSTADTVSYTNASGAAGNGRTLERTLSGTFTESVVDGGTPGAPNSVWSEEATPTPSPTPSPTPTPTPSPSPSSLPTPTPTLTPTPAPATTATPSPSPPPPTTALLWLSEILPNPEGSDADGEFIEIRNAGTTPVDLTEWKIRDVSGATFKLSGTLPAGAFRAFSRRDGNLPSLNNDGDTVELLDPSGNRRDGVRYGKAAEGLALARTDDGSAWEWTTTPTPDAPNIFSTDAAHAAPEKLPDSPIILAPDVPSGEPTPQKPSKASGRTGTNGRALEANDEVNGSALANALRASVMPNERSPLLLPSLASVTAGALAFAIRVWLRRRRTPLFIVEEEVSDE